VCIFCKKDSDEILHDFTSLAVDKKIRDMAKELEDFEMLSSISGGDLVAIEAQYHIGCLTKTLGVVENRQPLLRHCNRSST